MSNIPVDFEILWDNYGAFLKSFGFLTTNINFHHFTISKIFLCLHEKDSLVINEY